MKKSLLILACAVGALSISAQTPQDQAKAYYNTGKTAIKKYDDLLGRMKLGMLKDGENVQMAQNLMDAYDNFLLVLPLDSLPDSKGKVKPKYSKDIKNQISGHYTDFTDAGGFFYNAKDYKNAIRAWDTFIDLSENPDRFGITALPDSTVAMYMWNGALAAYEDNDFPLAAKKLVQAAKKGYNKEILYQYGLQIANQAKDNDAVVFFATEGDKIYGAQDTRYINTLINYYLVSEQYDKALSYLEQAIAQNPNGSQYYALEGIVYEGKDDMNKAMSLYKKAIDLDSENGLANFYYGRGLAIDASKLADNFTGTQAKYEAYYKSDLLPRYKEAIKVLEKAYKLDKNNRNNTLNLLEQLYYVTNDQAGMDSVKERKLADDED